MANVAAELTEIQANDDGTDKDTEKQESTLVYVVEEAGRTMAVENEEISSQAGHMDTMATAGTDDDNMYKTSPDADKEASTNADEEIAPNADEDTPPIADEETSGDDAKHSDDSAGVSADQRLLSRTAATVNLVKVFSGGSVFAMPWAFAQSGLLSGTLSVVVLALLVYSTLYWLGKCSHSHPSIVRPTYPEIASVAFGRIGFVAAWLGIVSMTLGVCGTYLVFIASQLAKLAHTEWLTQSVVTALVAIPMVLLSLFRSYSFLAPFNVLGLLSLAAALVIVSVDAASHLDFESVFSANANSNGVAVVANRDVSRYPLFLGNAAFAFLIHSVVLPIEQNMRDRTASVMSADYAKALRVSIGVQTAMLLGFSVLTSMAFGGAVCGNILDNLDAERLSTKLVVLTLCANLLLTFPLFLLPVAEAIESTLWKLDLGDAGVAKSTDWKLEFKRNALRVCLVALTAVLATLVPDFELVTGITGAVGNNMLGLVLPALMHCKLHRVSVAEKVVAAFSVLFGVGMFAVCSFSFVSTLMEDRTDTC